MEVVLGNDVSWQDRLRYAMDKTLARGSLGIIAWLAVLSALLVVGGDLGR